MFKREVRGSFELAALMMARAQKRLAEENDDADFALHAFKLERRALEAIALGLSVLLEGRET
jgi:hypothetical protein